MTKQELVERLKKAIELREVESEPILMNDLDKPRRNPVCLVIEDIQILKRNARNLGDQVVDNLLSAIAPELLGSFRDSDIEFFFRQFEFAEALMNAQDIFWGRYRTIRMGTYLVPKEHLKDTENTPASSPA